MQIGDTRWYTAKLIKSHEIPNSDRVEMEFINGYRMKLSGWSEEEIREHVNLLAADGIVGKIKTSKRDHTDIPAGEPFYQVSDKVAIQKLEKKFKEAGIALNPDRYAQYDKVMERGR